MSLERALGTVTGGLLGFLVYVFVHDISSMQDQVGAPPLPGSHPAPHFFFHSPALDCSCAVVLPRLLSVHDTVLLKVQYSPALLASVPVCRDMAEAVAGGQRGAS